MSNYNNFKKTLIKLELLFQSAELLIKLFSLILETLKEWKEV